jgi:hypothetical protein
MSELTYNDAHTHILTQNSETGGVWWCPAGVLPAFQARGWEPVELVADPDVPAPNQEVQPPALFEPSAHDVDTVNAYLAANAATNPAEVVRVLNAERAGKNRKTIAVPDGFDPITGD